MQLRAVLVMKCSFFKRHGGKSVRCDDEATHLVKNYYVVSKASPDAPACAACAKRLAAFPSNMTVVAVKP